MELYKLDFPSNKSYIGITSKSSQERLVQHCKLSSNYAINRAIKKYGKENVKLTVLATVDNWELLCLMEQEAIEKFNTKSPDGYNLTDGGDGVIGRIKSLEERQVRSIQMKAHSKTDKGLYVLKCLQSPESKAKHKKTCQSKVFKEKMSVINKGKVIPDYQKEILKNMRLGSIMPEETRTKISQSNKGKKMSPEAILKRQISRYGENYKPKQRVKI